MLDILKINLNTRVLMSCLFILIMGLSAGIFFGGIIPTTEKMSMLSLLQKSQAQLLPTVLMNLTALLLIALAGFTVYGFPLAAFILFTRSFAVGFCDCLLLCSIDSGGTAGFIFSFLLPQLLLCGLYLLTSAAGISYAIFHLRSSRT